MKRIFPVIFLFKPLLSDELFGFTHKQLDSETNAVYRILGYEPFGDLNRLSNKIIHDRVKAFKVW